MLRSNQAGSPGLPIWVTSGGLLYWFGFGGTFWGALSWYNQLAVHLAASLALAAGGWVLWKRTQPVRLQTLHPALNAAVGLLLLEKAIRALRGQSWKVAEDFAEAVALVIIFYLLLNIVQDGKGLAGGLLFASSVWCLAGMFAAHWEGYRELAMPLGNRVLMAGLLVLLAPLSGGLWRRDDNRPVQRVLILIGGFMLLTAIIKTRSATAVTILLFTYFVGLAVYLVRTRVTAVAVLVGVVVTASLLWIISDFEPIERLKAVVLRAEDPILSWNNRVRYWVGALPAIRAAAMFGYGPGQVGLVYPAYRLQQPVLSPHGEVVPDLHDVPMNWLFEFGLSGLALRVGLYIGFVFSAFFRGDRLQKAAALGLANYGVYSLFHYQLGNPAILCAVLCTALIATPRRHAITLSTRRATALSSVLICASVAILSFYARLDYAHYLFAPSDADRSAQGAGTAIRAALLDHRGGFYDFAAALRIRRLFETQPNGAAELGFLFEAANRHYSASLGHFPLMPQVLASYGSFLVQRGQPCAAIEPLQKAVSLDLYFSLSHFDLANAYRACSQKELAVQEAATAILIHPILIYATAWRKNPEFLGSALEQSLRWLARWNPPADGVAPGQVRFLSDFLRAGASSVAWNGSPVVALTFSDSVAGQLIDDPFAFLFQRRSSYFETTQIRIDGLPSGTWSPQGIGSFRWLNALTYPTVFSAYQSRGLDSLIVSIGTPQLPALRNNSGRQIGRILRDF